MSITAKELRRVRKNLGVGAFRRIAERLDVSQPWISRVMKDAELVNKHPKILEAALDLIEEDNQKKDALKNRIGGVIK